MIKVLYNQTASPIFITDVGVSIPASPASYLIQVADYPLWASSSDIVTFIGSGDIIVNDGSFDLSKADGIALLQGNFKQLDFINNLKNADRLKVEVLNIGGAIIQVSSDDQTTGYLEQKIVAESGATLVNTLNPGGDEKIEIGLPNVGTSNTYGSSSEVSVITTDTKGRVSTAISTPIIITSSSISNFNEAAQDAVGNSLTDSASIDFTYNDTLNTISAAVLPAGVNHNALQNYVANQHVDHSAINITAGTGLTGGGDITASRTIALANTAVTPGSYGSATQVPTYTVNAQGQLTASANTSIQIAQSQVTNLVTDLANKQPLDADLTALANNTTNGILVRTGAGTVASRFIAVTTGLFSSAPDGVIGNPTIGIGNTGVAAGSYGSGTQIPVITVNAQGQLTSATTSAISGILAANVTNTPSGDIVATNVQAAINELDSEKAKLAGGNAFTGTQDFSNGTIIFDSGGETRFGIGGYTDPDVGTQYNIKYGGTSRSMAVRGISYFLDQMGIGAQTPVASAKLQIDSTTQGFLQPRMTSVQRNAIVAPAEGLQVYDTDLMAVCRYSGTGWFYDFTIANTAIQTTASSTYNNLIEFVTPVLGTGNYIIEFEGTYQSTATNTGIGARLSQGTATINFLSINWRFSQAGNGTDKFYEYSQTGLGDNVTSTSTLATNTNYPVVALGVFSISNAGTVALQFRSENNGTTVSIRPTSILNIRKV